MKLWTLTKNTEDGITTTVHATAEAAHAAREVFLKKDWLNWCTGEFPGSEEAAETLGGTVGYMDSYGVDEHDVELVNPPVPDWVADFLNRRTTVEMVLRNIAAGRREALTTDEARELANLLGVPTAVQAPSTREAARHFAETGAIAITQK